MTGWRAPRAGLTRWRQGNALMVVRNKVATRSGLRRRLLPHPFATDGNVSARRIQRLLAALPDSYRYLEIGLYDGATLEAVRCTERIGVDPEPRFDTHRLPTGVQVLQMTSDQFFANLTTDSQFDVVFVDGLHAFEQTYRDIVHAFTHLRWNGALLVDDVVPSDRFSANPDRNAAMSARSSAGLNSKAWHGDVFIAMKVLHDHHPQIAVRTIVGSGNEQAVMWRADRRPIVELGSEILTSLTHTSYDDVFSQGLPNYFRPLGEDRIIEEFHSFAQGAQP